MLAKSARSFLTHYILKRNTMALFMSRENREMAGHVLSCHGALSLLYPFMFDMTLTNQSVFALTQKVTDSLTPPVVLFFGNISYNKLDAYDGKLNSALLAQWGFVEHWPTFAFV